MVIFCVHVSVIINIKRLTDNVLLASGVQKIYLASIISLFCLSNRSASMATLTPAREGVKLRLNS